MHRHHITPRCLLKHREKEFVDRPENIVELTFKQHVKAHKWLAMLTQDETLWWTWIMMSDQKDASWYLGMTPHNFGIPNPEKSEQMKGEGNPMFGKTHAPDVIEKISQASSDRIRTEEERQKSSRSKKKDWDNNPQRKKEFSKRLKTKNPMYSEECRKKMSETNRNREIGEHHRNVARKLMTERMRSQPTVICPHCAKEGKQNAMKRWHFDKCKYLRRVA